MTTERKTNHGSMGSYLTGFALSLICTLAAFNIAAYAMKSPLPPYELVIPAILVLALVQLFAQLFFFLHLWKGRGAGWNITALLFCILIVVIVVGGSLWIMNNLEHHDARHTMDGPITPQTLGD